MPMPVKWLLLSALSVAAMAQSKTSASVRGIVQDASEARVTQVRVILTNGATNAKFETVSGTDGTYLLPFVVPGTYRVEAGKEGFAAWKRDGLELTVGQEATLDIHLDVASSQLELNVTAEVPLIESQRTQQSKTLTQDSVRNLPINRRDYLTFSLLAPGVADSKALADSNSFRVKQTPDSGLSFYGSNGRGNSVNVDGGEANDPGGGVRPTVSQEAVQEFQVNRSNYSAEHGSARGGVINIVTRSGSNELHGRHRSICRESGRNHAAAGEAGLQPAAVWRDHWRADHQRQDVLFLQLRTVAAAGEPDGTGVDGPVYIRAHAGAGSDSTAVAGGGGGTVAGGIIDTASGAGNVPPEQRDFPVSDR